MAIRVCLPALGNNLVNLVKTTNLAYAIAVPELLYVRSKSGRDAANVREMMFSSWSLTCSWFRARVGTQCHRASPAVPGFGQKGGH